MGILVSKRIKKSIVQMVVHGSVTKQTVSAPNKIVLMFGSTELKKSIELRNVGTYLNRMIPLKTPNDVVYYYKVGQDIFKSDEYKNGRFTYFIEIPEFDDLKPLVELCEHMGVNFTFDEEESNKIYNYHMRAIKNKSLYR